MGMDVRDIFLSFCKDESGATAVEYVLLASILGVGLAFGIGALGNDTQTAYQNLGESVGTQVEGQIDDTAN